MSDDSVTYCDSEEELFFGKFTEKEAIKSTALGQNYASPAVNCSTPRPKAKHLAVNTPLALPDVLQGSSSTRPVEQEPSGCVEEAELRSVSASNNDSDVIVIDLDNQNDSIQIISDDESFIQDENVPSYADESKLRCDGDYSSKAHKESVTDMEDSTSAEPDKFENDSLSCNQHVKLETPLGTNEILGMNNLCQKEVTGNDEIELEIENFLSNELVASQVISVETSTTSIHNNSPIQSGMSSVDHSFLNRISDSILNVSYGSSLDRSTPPFSSKSSLDVQNQILYENISCDEDHHFKTAGNSLRASPAKPDDLHMSVDEPDIQERDDFKASFDVSQPSDYNSCLSALNNSSYFTTVNSNITTSIPPATEQSSGSFCNYREKNDDTNLVGNSDEIHSLEIEINSENETSFELIAQNRQNSFTETSSVNKPVENKSELVKPRTFSKLPVFKSSSSLLKPSKLNIKTGCVEASNAKWAKNLQKTNTNKNEMSLKKQETKMSKVPSSSLTPKSVHSEETNRREFKTPGIQMNCNNFSENTKTPLGSKLPASSTPGKSDSKIPKSLKPFVKNIASSGKEENVNKQQLFPNRKDHYKHIISPVRAYITGSSVVLQQKAQTGKEGNSRNIVAAGASHIPKRTPMKLPKAVQQLHYGNENGNNQGQENMDPNYARDTLPPRTLEAATAVFVKEAENPRRIPKHLHSLLDTPRPKVIIHQGRVQASPKKVLIPSTEFNSEHSSDHPANQDISIRVVKSAEKTNTLK